MFRLSKSENQDFESHITIVREATKQVGFQITKCFQSGEVSK